MIRKIRDLLYDQGFTISGARNKLLEIVQFEGDKRRNGEVMLEGVEVIEVSDSEFEEFDDTQMNEAGQRISDPFLLVRQELFEIRDLLAFAH